MTEQTHDTPLSARLGLFGRVDDAVYKLEMIVAVTALVLMSIMVFADVVYQFVVGISQSIGAGDSQGWMFTAAVLAFVGLIAFAATGDPSIQDDEPPPDAPKRPLGVRLGITAAVVAASAVVGWSLLVLESATVCRAVLVALSIPIALTFVRRGEKRRLVVFVIAALLAFLVFGALPAGYSWSQSYSLILLLWVSFLGASIAARERRHLRVDLVRKLLPPTKVPAFNAVSYLVAAAFTAIVLYLGIEYMFGHDSTYLRPVWDAPTWLPAGLRTSLMEDFPLPDDASIFRRALQVFFVPNEPGELPDWLKVAAIPFSMFLICVRFVGHAVVFARMAARGEEFHEVAGSH